MFLADVSLVLSLLLFEVLDELVNLLLLLVEDFVLLLVTISILLLVHVRVNLFDVSLVSVDNFSSLSELLLELLDFLVLRLDTVHKSFTSFGERKVHLVGLELKITLTLGQVVLLFTQMLGTLLESVLFQGGFGLHESLSNLF